MIKQLYTVYGMKNEADEARLCEAVKERYPDAEVSASSEFATLTLLLPEERDAAFDDSIGEIVNAQGYSLHLPVIKSETKETPEVIRKPAERSKSKGVPVSVFVASLCAVLVFAILFTYTVSANIFAQKFLDIYPGNTPSTNESISEEYQTLDLLRQIFEAYSVLDIDDEALMDELLRAYVRATGDEYAVYYTAEELDALFEDTSGKMVGIGVSVVNSRVAIGGVESSLLTVISAYKNSPASEAGIRAGDLIYSVTLPSGEIVYVDEVGYDEAISLIRGVEGSDVTLTVLRPQGGNEYESLTFTMTRRPFDTMSVEYRVLEEDNRIGVVKITEFDMTTPPQFKQAMDDLISRGCDQFIFDLRYNGGGDLQSIIAVLSTLLEKDDVLIYTVDNQGNREVDKVEVRVQSGYYESCTTTKEDIGRYRGYDFVVLTNEYTASAAELFTANMRDYDLATLVGVTTYGKGCVQSILDLSYFGVEGGLRLTTAWYYPPSEESYHGIGIVPDVEVVFDQALLEKYGNVYLIPDAEDNQLAAAVDVLQGK